jgi:signal transduction histidine kinase
VLGNLIDNALRHTPRSGHIEATVRISTPGLAEIIVADTGEGISPADLPHVFDRFYRSAIGEPEMPGSGLGLAISREIVRAHGGEIRASARIGGGTEFAFTLPLAPGVPASAGDAEGSPAPQAHGPADGLQPSS